MIQYRASAHVLGRFLLVLAATMIVPLLYAAYAGGGDAGFFVSAAAVTAAVGGLLVVLMPRPTHEIGKRDALLLVVMIWVGASLFGGLPFLFSPHFEGLTDAFFESASGFTTTGATVLDRVEALTPGLQLWRCLTHWLGGMGIVVLGIAVLPLVGPGGMQLYRAEFSGARSERLRPRIRETAMALSWIYLALTVAQFAALRWAGMTGLEAACHTFSTLGTGGFSTRSASVAGFDSPAIEYIIIVFMILAGASFVQQYRLWVERRPADFLHDVEVRAYFLIIGVATLVIATLLVFHSGYPVVLALRRALFQVASITTTTGFATDDFELWHPLPQLLLIALMFVGGCTGSTAGGMKTSRIVLLSRVVDREFKRMVERRGVFAIRLGDKVVPESTVQGLLNLVYLAFVVFFTSCLLLAAVGVDPLTSITAVAATMFNVGPGLGTVGPMETYSHLPALAKWVLTGCMLAGRLEFYTVIVVLTPAFWRK